MRSPQCGLWSTILERLRRNRRLEDASRPLSSSCSGTDPDLTSSVGDEVAPFSAARQSAELGTNAITTPKAFGCGCAALSRLSWKSKGRPRTRADRELPEAKACPYADLRQILWILCQTPCFNPCSALDLCGTPLTDSLCGNPHRFGAEHRFGRGVGTDTLLTSGVVY